MILDLTLAQDEKTKKILAEQAQWNPSQAVKDRTFQVMRDFQECYVVRNKPYPEFNLQSLLQRITLDQTSYNQYPGAASIDPMQSWKSLAFRPIVRNKIISIAAHITATTVFPQIYAQNERDEEDRDAAEVMRDLVEYFANEAGYPKTFLYTVIAALVNPAAFIYKGYAEVKRRIKEIQADGSWVEKEIVDEEQSGIKDRMVPVDELWIKNIYIHDVQEQPCMIWRRVLDYTQAKELYPLDEFPNFAFVQPGLQFLYSNLYNLFYQQYDVSLQQNLVEEVVYYNKTADLELRFVNGILMSDPDQPMKRADKKYPFVKTGYELYDDGRFFYYKSLAFKMESDETVINTLYRMIIDGTYLNIFPPAVVFGSEAIGNAVIAPGAITTIDNSQNPNAAFETIKTNNNLGAGMQMLEKVESSASESSIESIGGNMHKMTAYEMAALQQQAANMYGLFQKMIGFMVEDYGKLLIGDILQHVTVGQATDVIDSADMLKFRKILIPDKTVDGKKKSKRIEFDMDLPDEVSPDGLMKLSRKVQADQKKIGDNMKIIRVNPALFRQLKYKVVCVPEAINPKSDTLRRQENLEEYDRAMQNPLVMQNPAALEAVTRDLLFGSYDITKDDPDKYLPKQPQGGAPQMGGGMPQPGGQPNPPNGPTGALGKLPGNPAVAAAMGVPSAGSAAGATQLMRR